MSVIRRNPDRTWHGDMLDGQAFVAAQIARGARVDGARALLVGAGGAGSAIALALLEAGVRELVVHDPDAARVAALRAVVDGVGDGWVIAGPPDPGGCDLVCNASPLGMAEGDPLPVAPVGLTPDVFVGDVIAGHGVTPLVAAAEAIGCRTAGGSHMVEAAQQIMADFLLAAGTAD